MTDRIVPTETETSSPIQRVIAWSRERAALMSLIGVLFVVMFIAATQRDVFLTVGNLRNILIQVSVLMIVASGTTILMVSGGIDLSIGSIMSLSAVVAALLMANGGHSLLWILVAAVVVGALCGTVNGALAANSVSHPFIVTLGTMILVQGIAIQLTGGIPLSGLDESFVAFARHSTLGVPNPVWLAGLVVAFTATLLGFTTFGRRLYAIGGNERAAVLAGVSVKWTKVAAYTVSGVLTAIGGLLLASRISSAQPLMGVGFELSSIAAVAIGGTPLAGGRGSIVGTLIGVLLLGVISNSLSILGVSGSFQLMLQGAVIVVAVMSQRTR